MNIGLLNRWHLRVVLIVPYFQGTFALLFFSHLRVVLLAPYFQDSHSSHLGQDIHPSRPEIHPFTSDKGHCSIHAFIPLAQLVNYTSDMRNATSDTASFTMEPWHYPPAREEVAYILQAS
jgi:hypothetical protein